MLTAALLGGIAARRLPVAVWWEENVIQNATGLPFTLGSVEYHRWNLRKYGQVELPHPNTGQKFVTFPEVELRHSKSDTSKSSSLLSLFLPFWDDKQTFPKLSFSSVSVEISPKAVASDIRILGNMLLDQFGDRFSARKTNLSFHCDELEISVADSLPDMRFKLTFLEGTFLADETECKLECTFSLQDNPSRDPVRFTIRRKKQNLQNEQAQTAEPELIVELQTDETEVPVRFLALFFPTWNSLGPKAFFHGTVRGESSRKDYWTITFEDMGIGNADLQTLGAELTPYPLSGETQIGIASARIETDGTRTRFLDASGWIRIVNGAIDRRLLTRLVEDWQLSPMPNDAMNSLYQNNLDVLKNIPVDQAKIPIADASLSVLLGKDGVLLRSNEKGGFIFASDRERYYKYHLPKQMGTTAISYSAIFGTFSPPNADVLSLTPQTQKLIQHLPYSPPR